jgi:hypothetical protein
VKAVKIPIKTVYVPVAGKYRVGFQERDYRGAYDKFLMAANSEAIIMTDTLFSDKPYVDLDSPLHELERRGIPVTVYACHDIQYWRMSKLRDFKNVKLYVLDSHNEPATKNYIIIDSRWGLFRGRPEEKESLYFIIEDCPKGVKQMKSQLEALLVNKVKIEPVKKRH